MPAFIQDALQWATVSGGHFLIMFWWIWASAVVVTAVAESVLAAPVRRRLVEGVDRRWRSLALAIALGMPLEVLDPIRAELEDYSRRVGVPDAPGSDDAGDQGGDTGGDG